MTEKAPFNLDAALAALKLDEREAYPAVTESLQTRVLADAAMVAAERADAAAAAHRSPAPNASQGFGQLGGLRLFKLFDAWSGVAVAAVVLCLVAGLGVGYEAGPEVMDQMGLSDTIVAVAADQGDGFFQSEDVL